MLGIQFACISFSLSSVSPFVFHK